jgi:hypothetical protein
MTIEQKRILAKLLGRCLVDWSGFLPATPRLSPSDGFEARTFKSLLNKSWLRQNDDGTFSATDAGRAALGDRSYKVGEQ